MLALANFPAQRGDGLRRGETYGKLVVLSAADYGNFAGVLSDPNHAFGIDEDFHAVHIFKHDELHEASIW